MCNMVLMANTLTKSFTIMYPVDYDTLCPEGNKRVGMQRERWMI